MNNAPLPRPRMINGRPDPAAWIQAGLNDDGSITYRHKYDQTVTFQYRHEPKAKITRDMPPAAPKKPSVPKKPVTRDTILAVLKECQPATPDVLRVRMRERGYDLDGAVAVKRMSNVVYRLRMAGEVKQHTNNALTLPDYTGSVSLPASKTLTHEVVLNAVEQCQPADCATLRAHLLDAGYKVGGYSGKKRLSSSLGYLKRRGQLVLQHGKLWALDDLESEQEPEPDHEPEPEPVAAAQPDPEPGLQAPGPQKVEVSRIDVAIRTPNVIDGGMTVSIDADNTVTFEDEQNRMITLHIAELGKLISILPQLRALLDDPQ